MEDFVEELFEEVGLRLKGSARGRTIARICFGLLGAGLSVVGTWHIATGWEAGLHLRVVGAIMFVSLGAFWLFNVALLKRWRWPAVFFALSFVLLFVVRIVFGRWVRDAV